MARSSRKLVPGTLWERVTAVTARALAGGALVPIETRFTYVEDAGVRFLLRVVANLRHKPRTTGVADGSAPNPFLPYDEALFVADVSPTHLGVLNKFNVIDHHLLIVTREFEHQENLLGADDFAAMWTCLTEYEGLAFYNAGKVAGASQPHKHLQLVPLPLAPEGPDVPVDPLLERASFRGGVGRAEGLPFRHAMVRVEPAWLDAPDTAAAATLEAYAALLEAVGLSDDPVAGSTRQSAPYNLLATRRWMLLVPRSLESFDSISINALGFAGALLARDEAERERLVRAGPMNVLRTVAKKGTDLFTGKR